ncbi:PKD domain-containing protein [Reichenbachiella agariperforans]|uniref:PKD domain-containing protein n=1 Tax=Reichenbachiella agariperforans TaxID=156994 RepID=UPI001C08A1C2|nr:PKD domain-containing protein [Reichenbachiella agariperforans]MBU2914309.1 gliding motility-associated C-terminal domain-containing protein [Reichenbachiella agariperforans]
MGQKSIIRIRPNQLVLWQCFVMAVLSMVHFGSHAQDQNYSEYNWLFGNSTAGITFNKSDARAQLDNIQQIPYGIGGGAVITNPVTGDLIFYSDGERVFDINHNPLPGNPLLNGNPAINRSAVVFPLPYSTGQYYLFTNSGSAGVNEIQYSILDRTLTGNAVAGEPVLGDVSSLNNGTGLVDPSEAMIVIKQDADNYWLISQNRTTLEYRVTALSSATGVGVTTTFAIGTVTDPAYEAASFAYDEINGRLAIAPKEENRNVYVMDLDIATGTLVFNRAIRNTGFSDGTGEAVYDLEWSASGDQLYISRFGSSAEEGDLYQFDFNDTVETVNSILFQPVFRSYGIQRGPDQNIYHLYQQTSGDAIEIGRITEADSTYHEDSLFFNVGYDSLAFAPSNINGRQFPAFAAPHFEMFDTVSFFLLDTCTSQSTKFFSMVEPTPESYVWDFGTGDSLSGPAPVYTFPAAGTYSVSLTVTLNGIEESYTRVVSITENDLVIDLGMDTVRCPGEVFTYDAGDGGLTYAWNTGETTQTIDVDTTGIFSVAVETAAGCRSYGYVQVVTYEDESQFRNQWYFGENAGIDFNDPNGTVAITDANLMTSPQAASSVSDLNGDLLFYTNGVTVWNKEHQIMVNGTNIGGDSTSMQGAMIMPFPGDSTTFYVFTSDPVYGDNTYNMRYSIVDMKQDVMRGAVVQKNLPFFTNSTERMTGVGLGQGLSWLITHEFGNNQFKSYPVTATGIGEPLTSAAGSVLRLDEEKNATAEMQVAQAGNYIAMAIQDTNENYIELFEIDTFGVVSQIAKIDVEEPLPALIYGVEFSSGAEKLYVTTHSNGSKLLQYDLDSIQAPTAEADIMATKYELGASASLEFGALQTGADAVIYMAIEGQTTIGTINSPAADDDLAGFVVDGFDLEGRTSRLGLPNFAQTVPLTAMQPGALVTNACLGQETIFDGSGTSIIDNYLWTFDDGTSAAVEDTTHLYNLTGIYNVSLQVTNRCGLDTTFLQPVEVFAIPTAPTVEDAVTLCNGPVMLEAWPIDTAAFSYTWSTGDTTRQITVTQASIVSVFITDTTGCQSDPRESFVDDTSPIVNLGPDQMICQDVVFAPLDAQNPGSAYTWSLNATPNGNTLSQQEVDTSVPGVYLYEVEVVDIFNCSTIDDIELTVQPTPNYTFTPTPTTGCGATDGALNIDITDAGSFTYGLSGPVSVTSTAIAGPSGDTQIANNLSGGGYTITVTNTVSGCANPQLATVADGGTFTLSVAPVRGCPGDGELEVTVNAPVTANVDYELFDEVGNSIFASSATLDAANQFAITNLDSGTYSLVVEGVDGLGNVCVGTLDDIQLDGNERADFSVDPQYICGTEGQVGILPVTVNAADPVLYSWTGPNIIGSAQGDSVVVGTAGSYFVTSSSTGYCDYTQEVIVTQNDLPEVQIDVTGNECDGSLLLEANITSTLVGNPAYEWDNGNLTSQRNVTNTGTYTVSVLDQGTGCVNTVDRTVDVFDELTVFIAADPNCDDNSEVFLSAYASISEDVTFTWTDLNGEVLSETGAEISISESGSYSVNVASDVSVCQADASIDVAVTPIDEDQLTMSPNESFCSQDPDPQNSEVALDPGAFTSYVWTIINDTDVLGTDRILVVNTPGVYEVTIGNGFSCIRDIVEVFDNCAPIIYAPNAFAPNGTNDQFFVYPNDYVSNFSIKIYSRWGELVYYSENINFRWDGYYRGQLLQMGTYAYIMTFESSLQPERGQIQQRGGVMIVR